MPTGNGDAYLQALASEHAKARECVAALRCYLAFDPLKIRRSALWNAMGTAASERIVMTLARILDDDANTITAISLCRYLEQNPTECAWAYTTDGRAKYADPGKTVRELARKWHAHWAGHPLRDRIKKSRDKTIAHLDKKQWLNAEALSEIRIPEVEELLDDLILMINEFKAPMENGQIYDMVFAVVSHESAMTMAGYELWLKGMGDGSIDRDAFDDRVEEIKAVIERQD